MNPSRIFILRPVATTLLMAAIMMVGLFAYRFLPLSALPEVDYPTIQVQTFYPGASPDVMTSSVTAPLEVQLGQMPGLNQMSSTSSAGASVITLQFSLDLSLDVAEQEVQAAINAAGNLLPTDLPAPPIYAKVNPADAPILTLAVTSKTMPLTQVEDLVDTRIAQKISQVAGVGLVSISGGNTPAVRIQANNLQLAAYGLNIDDLRTTLANANVNTPKGNFDGPSRAYTINANDQIHSAKDYDKLVIAYRNGAPVRLEDVGKATEAAENTALAAWVNTEPAVIVNIQRQPNANVIGVVDIIEALLPSLKAALPPAVDLQVVTDRTTTIRASVSDVEFELGLAVVLVVIVIFLFLRSPSATLIPSLSVPLSLVGTLAFMYLAGFSLNNLSLMALTIATGFVVDDAIVVIENITRYIEAGDPPVEAALKGSAQIGFTIISLTVSLIAVLIPLLFMPDVVGRLFREFAITLAVTIIISAVVALTLVPMMCAKILRHRRPSDMSRFARKSGEWFDALIARYGRLLNWVLDHQPLTLIVAAATLALTVLLYVVIPKGFFPVQDTGLIQGISVASPSVSFAAMSDRQQALASAILEDPAVASLTSFIGVDGTNTTLDSGRFLINLKPRGQRTLFGQRRDPAARTGNRQGLRHPALHAAGAGSDHRFDGQPLGIPVRARGRQRRRICDLGPQIAAKAGSDPRDRGCRQLLFRERSFGLCEHRPCHRLALRHHPGHRRQCALRFVRSAHRLDDLYPVEPVPGDPRSRSAAAAILVVAGLDLSAVVDHDQWPGAAVGDRPGRAADRPARNRPSGSIPVDDGVVQPGAGRSTRHRRRCDPAGRDRARDAGQHDHRVPGCRLGVPGRLGQRVILILAAIVTVYIVLGVLYESFIHPITILSTLPSAGVGALLALMLDGSDLSVIAIIGIILLIGIVKKNAIMMVDFALDAERHRARPRARRSIRPASCAFARS